MWMEGAGDHSLAIIPAVVRHPVFQQICSYVAHLFCQINLEGNVTVTTYRAQNLNSGDQGFLSFTYGYGHGCMNRRQVRKRLQLNVNKVNERSHCFQYKTSGLCLRLNTCCEYLNMTILQSELFSKISSVNFAVKTKWKKNASENICDSADTSNIFLFLL